MIVLIIICLTRRGKRHPSYPELDEIVKETIGATDLHAFGEKDIDIYDITQIQIPRPRKNKGNIDI